MIPPFELYQPTAVEDAVRLMREHGDEGWVLAGGLDTFDWFKDRIKRPTAVIDLGAVDAIRGISGGADGGLDIGAMTSLTEIAENADVMSRYPLLAEAAGLVATPQIRNQGTLGGNIVQDTRCWYYRSGWPCYRAGGNVCYAATSQSMNREHCSHGREPLRRGEPVRHGPGACRAGRRDGGRQHLRRAHLRRSRLLHRTGHRHRAHDGAQARRPAHPRHPSGPVAERALVLREDPGPQVVGLLAGQRCVVAPGRNPG